VSSVAEHPLPEAQSGATSRNMAQQNPLPAQNEPSMDKPPRLPENRPPPPMNAFKPLAVVLLAALTLLAPATRAQQPAAAPPKPATPPKNLYADYKERWVTPPRVANDLLAHKTYHSAAMNTDVGYHVYLPPGYGDPKNAQTRYPVIYWLHGLNQSESSNWYPPKELDAAVRTGEVPPVIVIFASGGGRTFYVDSADGKLLSETTVIKELIPHVDATYRTIAARDGRAIQGMSMGGWGALRLAMTYPEMFSSVVAFAPSLRQPDNLAATYPDILKRMFGGDEKRFWEKHPLHLAEANAERIRGHLPIAFYCGLADDLLPGSQNLHKLLTGLKIDHTYIEVEKANHSMTPLVAALKHSNLIFAAKHFTVPQAQQVGAGAAGN
jgi:endo-1,4-beta-xylanase